MPPRPPAFTGGLSSALRLRRIIGEGELHSLVACHASSTYVELAKQPAHYCHTQRSVRRTELCSLHTDRHISDALKHLFSSLTEVRSSASRRTERERERQAAGKSNCYRAALAEHRRSTLYDSKNKNKSNGYR